MGVDKAGELNMKQKKCAWEQTTVLTKLFIIWNLSKLEKFLGKRTECGRRAFYLILETLGSPTR